MNQLYSQLIARVHAWKKNQLPLAPEVKTALLETNLCFSQTSPRTENLRSLEKGEAAVIVTGQQLGLFGGPLLTYYKAYTACKLAEKLRQDTGCKVVPVFWLQAEDHDLLEIHQATILTQEHLLATFSVDNEKALNNRNPVGLLSFEEDITKQRELFAAHFPEVHQQQDCSALLKDYRTGRTYKDAFAHLLAEAFSAEGLLLFDPQHAALRSLASPFYLRAFEECENIGQLLRDRSTALLQEGKEEQVKVRPRSPLFFISPEDSSFARYRLEPALGSPENAFPTQWQCIGTELHKTTEDIRTLIREMPERCSSSALLRPLLQDIYLSPVCYVGGAAELRYFEQIEPLYDFFGIPRPLAVPRASYLLLEPKAIRLLEQLGLSSIDPIEISLDTIHQAAYAGIQTALLPENARQRLLEGIETQLESFSNEAKAIDPTVEQTIARGKEKIIRAIDGIVDRYRLSVQQRTEINRARVQRLETMLFPNGEPQERVLNFASFYLRFRGSLRPLLDEAFVACDAKLKVIRL